MYAVLGTSVKCYVSYLPIEEGVRIQIFLALYKKATSACGAHSRAVAARSITKPQNFELKVIHISFFLVKTSVYKIRQSGEGSI